MAKRKKSLGFFEKKNIIDSSLIEFRSSDYTAKDFGNFYQIRIWNESIEGFFDWYFTTGSLTHTTDRSCAKIGMCNSAVEVIELIYNKYLKDE